MPKTSSDRSSPLFPIAIGRITKPHGVRGEMKVTPFFDDTLEKLVGRPLTLQPEKKGDATRTVTLESVRGGGGHIIALVEIETPEAVTAITPALLLAPKNAIPPLPDGHYFYEEIIGLTVYDPQGGVIGELVDFFSAGATDVWTIKTPEGDEIMTPCLPEILLSVDLEEERIVMKLMEIEE